MDDSLQPPDEDEPPSTYDELPGVHVENLQSLTVDTNGASDLVAAVLEAEGYPTTTQVTVVYVDDDHMARLNREHLGGRGPTGVISVPLENLTPGTPPEVNEDGPPLMLGDIFVAPATVARKHQDGDVDSLALMVVHGMYHLLGWDHVDDVEAESMEERERAVLERVGKWRP